MSPRRTANLPARGEVGSATVWMVFATLIVFAVCGLVYDGGALLTGRQQAIFEAESAARAGAQAVDTEVLYSSGQTQLDPQAAEALATQFLLRNGWQGTASATPTQVTVTVEVPVKMTFLQTVGMADETESGSASASPEIGP